MKIKELIKFSFDEMIRKWGQWFLFFVSNCVAITLLIIVVFLVKLIEVNQDDFETLFKYDIDRYGVLSIDLQYGGRYTSDEYSEEEAIQIYQEIKSRLGDEFVVFYYENNSSMITNPDEQISQVINESDKLNVHQLGIVYYTDTVFDEFDIKYKKTDVPNKGNYPALYLGSYWGESLLGKVVTVCDNTYFVEGVLEVDAQIPNEGVWYSNMSDLRVVNSLNDAMILVHSNEEYIKKSNEYSLTMQFRYDDFERMQDELEDIFCQYKGYVSVSRLQDSVYAALIPFKSLRTICTIFVVVAFVTIAIIYSISQFLLVIQNREELGIYYLNGATVRDLISIQFIKTALQTLSSLVIAVLGSYMVICSVGNNGGMLREAVRDVVIWRTYPPVIVITILFSIVLAIVPVILVSKNKPADLVR